MQIRNPNPTKEFFIRKLTGLLYRLENTGNGDFDKNGEPHFMQAIGHEYAGKEFVFFDIGANKGEYTDIILQSAVPSNESFHLFEPQKTCFKLLQDKFGKDANITLNNFGLSDAASEATLYKDVDQSGLASVHKRNLDHFDIQMGMSEQISLKKASDYIVEKGIKHINLIKIDVEGHEIPALSGFGDFLNADNVDFIQFEYGGANLDSHSSLMELFAFFEKRGFKVCKIMKRSLEARKYDPRFENFVYQNYVAVSPRLIS